MIIFAYCDEPESEVCKMAISYKKLWKLLIDLDLKKKDLPSLAGISSASVTKLGKNENVNTEILEKICRALKCDISDIMEMTDQSRE
jgi:DNA-binding Xre family transcriptional regulator